MTTPDLSAHGGAPAADPAPADAAGAAGGEPVRPAPLVVVTFDWVPDFARGYVRDLRVRWAAEEAGLPYRIETVPARVRSAAHRAMQPFEHVPVLKDGDLTLFESGAILWRLGEGSEALAPRDAKGRAETVQWLFAAVNSVEPYTVPWVQASAFLRDPAQTERAAAEMRPRLDRLSDVLAGRAHLAAGRLTVADILMADVLRVADAFGGLGEHPTLQAYVARMTDRPAFRKAHADQMAHWAAADARAPAPAAAG